CYAQEFFEEFSIGGSMKFLHWSTPDIIGQTNVDEAGLSKFTASFEVGVQTQIRNVFPDNDLRFGLSLSDFTQPNIAVSDSLASPLDAKLVLGGSYISRVYNYSITVHYTSVGEVKHWGIGAEVNILKTTVADLPAELIVRVGGNGLTHFTAFQDGALSLKINTAEETIAGGFGIRFASMEVDYAYGSSGELMNAGGTHHISLRYSF
ncbi:MAG: type IX secretion system membrane protein PorP/SprF, partial [Bacteroidota bacterium]